jgi:hypothetical protein
MAKLIILVAVILAGVCYGWVSGLFNQNPHYPEPGKSELTGPDHTRAWNWKPSPLLLPSYLVCVLPEDGYGIEKTPKGYMFRTEEDRKKYIKASAVVGGVIGLVLGLGIVIMIPGKKPETENGKEKTS